MGGDRVVSGVTPAPQTLMVLSAEPDTIFVPSWLKSTEKIKLLWAFSLLVMSSKVSVKSIGWLMIGH